MPPLVFVRRTRVMQPCPSCKMVDKVRHVSSISFVGETYQTDSSTPESDIRLAFRLSLPPEPTSTPALGCLDGLFYLSLLCSIFFITALIILPPGVSMQNRFLALIVGSLVVAFVTGIVRGSSTQRAERQKQLIARWRHMNERWYKACYCSRCDVIYIDGENDYVPARKMKSLLAKGG